MAICNLIRWKTILILITTLLPGAALSSSFPRSDISPSRLCRTAIDPDTCETVLNQTLLSPDGDRIRTPSDLLRKFLSKYLPYMKIATLKFGTVRGEFNHPREKRAVADCLELMGVSISEVRDTIRALSSHHHSRKMSKSRAADAQTSLSAVLTNHLTCIEGLNPPEKSSVRGVLDDVISRARIALAVLAEITGQNEEAIGFGAGAFPSWVKSSDRKLLQSNAKNLKADIVVSQDGKGKFATLAKAVESVPDDNGNRVVIYVKKGIYKENVFITMPKRNVMIYGDGMNETIFSGDHSYMDNYTTYNTYTLASKGANFILQDLCVRNTAGAAKHQAVALLVGGDKSIINRCLLDGYQDTLYTHSKRQFYRDCNITGTIDFVFGNAAVVFQNCNLIARKPMPTQLNMVTAQGRADPNQNTGTSIQSCNIIPSHDLAPVTHDFPTFLGRPWRNFSRTMIMESFIGAHIDPTGWHEWAGNVFLDTLWFGEYSNRGPGSSTGGRVKWPTVHAVTDRNTAVKFTVAKLLQGDEDPWVIDSGVDCIDGLLPPRRLHDTNQSNVNVS